MNIKKIEKSLEEKLVKIVGHGTHKDWFMELESLIMNEIRKALTQVVESVPTREKGKVWEYSGMDTPEISISKEEFRQKRIDGYNRHVQEIKQWKEKILKELKEEK